MKQEIEKLIKEKDELEGRLMKINKAISSLRDVCLHIDDDGNSTLAYDGHDSHKAFYKCTICGKEEWV